MTAKPEKPVKKAKPVKKPKPAKKKNPVSPISARMSLTAKRKIYATVALFFLVLGYVALFFVPGVPGAIWMRILLALVFSVLMVPSVFYLIKKRLTAQDMEYIQDEENYKRAIRAMIQTKFYTKKLPGFPNGVRKEIFPSLGIGFLLFILMCAVSPCRPPEAPLPDFSKMAAQEFYYPQLFAASESVVMLTPPLLSAETETWAQEIPPKYLEWTMYTDLFQNRPENAYAAGSLCAEKTAGVLLAMAQASLILGEYDRAVAEYEEAQKLGHTGVEIAFQHAVALAYAGKLEEAEKAFDALDSKAVTEAVGDSTALTHWKLLVKILHGDLSDETSAAYESFYRKRDNELKKFNAKLGSETGNDSGDKKEGKTAKIAKNSAQNVSENSVDQKTMLARRIRSSANNMAVVHVLRGEYDRAVPTANAVLPYVNTVSGRSALALKMTVNNTKGLAAGYLRAEIKDESAPASGYFTETRTLYESFLSQTLPEGGTLNTDYRNTAFYVTPWANEVNFALTNQFTSETYPDVKAFQEKYAEALELCQKLHKKWSGAQINSVPAWAVAVETLLMRESLILEGLDQEENYNLATRICNTHFPKDASLPLVALRTERMALHLLCRFAAKEALMIKMLDDLLDEQKKTARMSKEVLPEFHPLLARQTLETLRLTLSRSGLKKKELTEIRDLLARAREILAELKYAPESVYNQELAASDRIVDAMKKRELAEIQAIFAPEIEKMAENMFRQSSVYRDYAFALQHRDFTTEADAANRSARAIFNQQIYRNNTQHILILQMDKILKH
ncbi:MAG: hypothetical protein Q4C70_08090 [Planctomycetia bacterium]|nr:hypothetical protein [Planctomycetia bacterium]